MRAQCMCVWVWEVRAKVCVECACVFVGGKGGVRALCVCGREQAGGPPRQGMRAACVCVCVCLCVWEQVVRGHLTFT